MHAIRLPWEGKLMRWAVPRLRGSAGRTPLPGDPAGWEGKGLLTSLSSLLQDCQAGD